MNQYITGAMIKRLREERNMTQAEFAKRVLVSDKTVSKWETGKGYPDITLIENIAEVLGISVLELFEGRDVINKNTASNMLRTKFYVCPICGNVIHSIGEASMSCHGITLPPLEAENADEDHRLKIEKSEDEIYVYIDHPMDKTHYISFIASVSYDGIQLTKLYPEGRAEARFKIRVTKCLFYYCNRHGLFKIKVPRFSDRIKEITA